MQVLAVKRVVREHERGVIFIIAGQGGRQAGGREAIGFQSRLVRTRGGIEMEAEEQGGVELCGPRHAFW